MTDHPGRYQHAVHQSHQTTSHLGVLVTRPEIGMQSALGLLALVKPDEVQPRQAIRLRWLVGG